MNEPRVSVLMAAYNAMPYLPAAVDSILGQTLQDFEFVIIDDGSTDDSAAYLASLSDPRVRVIWQENAGLSAALNRGLQACRAPYVARMDADDFSLPERLERQAHYLDEHAEVGCLGCQAAPFGERRAGESFNLPTTHQSIMQSLAEGRHAIVHPSVMMRRDAVQQIGGYWPMRVVAEDYDLFLRLGEVTEFASLDEVLFRYRFHMASINGSGMKRLRRSVDYACDRAKRRRAGEPAISFEDFCAARDRAPALSRWRESVDAYARSSYRAGIGDLYGRHVARGYFALALAAALAPQLTVQRLARLLGFAAH